LYSAVWEGSRRAYMRLADISLADDTFFFTFFFMDFLLRTIFFFIRFPPIVAAVPGLGSPQSVRYNTLVSRHVKSLTAMPTELLFECVRRPLQR
jgi:hypothetical protein